MKKLQNSNEELRKRITSDKFTGMWSDSDIGAADTVSTTSADDSKIENLTPTEKANRWLRSLN